MIAQHIILQEPIFETLFPESSLIKNSPISQALEKV